MARYSDHPAPAPGAHYSACVTAGELAFISGQLPIDDEGGLSLANADFGVQMRQALANLAKVLDLNGLSRENTVKVSVYISDIAFWSECNDIYRDFFGALKPARTIVPTGPLHFGFKVELEATIHVPA